MEGRFCSLDQTHSACESTLVENYLIPSPKLSEEQKQNISSSQFGTILAEISGIYSCWLALFVWSSSAQISMGGR